jgi:hypothetical protein
VRIVLIIPAVVVCFYYCCGCVDCSVSSGYIGYWFFAGCKTIEIRRESMFCGFSVFCFFCNFPVLRGGGLLCQVDLFIIAIAIL